LFFARFEASELGCLSIETEHLLLGVLRSDQGVARSLFARVGVSYEPVRATFHTASGEKVSTAVEIPFAEETKRALGHGMEEADRLGHSYIGSEHLLLGLLHEERSIAGALLAKSGMRLDDVREQLRTMLEPSPAPARPSFGIVTRIEPAVADSSMSREAVVAVARALLESARRHDIPRMMELYAEDAVAISPVFGEMKGRAAIAATWETLFSTVAEFSVEISHMLVDRDRIAVLGSVEAIDRVGWFGRAATGGPISYRIVLLFTVAGGKVVRDERIYDSLGVVERLEKNRLDKELRTAAEVQRALMTRTARQVRFCESVGDSVPCRAIGGDFFEFLELPSGDAGIVMGDVSGKGPAAALLAALVQGMLAVEAPAGDRPAATLARINRRLAARELESRFVTLVYAVLASDGRLTYSNAGHNAAVLLTRDGTRRLSAGGPILGAFADAVFEEETLQLSDGDTLVMFTDGVTEARGPYDEEFGEFRLMACLRAYAASSPTVLLNRTFDAVREFCEQIDQSDDITVAVTRFRE
jgi:ketosteroid isomerase-like protein